MKLVCNQPPGATENPRHVEVFRFTSCFPVIQYRPPKHERGLSTPRRGPTGIRTPNYCVQGSRVSITTISPNWWGLDSGNYPGEIWPYLSHSVSRKPCAYFQRMTSKSLPVEKKGFEPSLDCLQSRCLTCRATSPSVSHCNLFGTVTYNEIQRTGSRIRTD